MSRKRVWVQEEEAAGSSMCSQQIVRATKAKISLVGEDANGWKLLANECFTAVVRAIDKEELKRGSGSRHQRAADAAFDVRAAVESDDKYAHFGEWRREGICCFNHQGLCVGSGN